MKPHFMQTFPKREGQSVQTTQTTILLNTRETWRIKVRVDQEKTETATKTGARQVQLEIEQYRNIETRPLTAGDPAKSR